MALQITLDQTGKPAGVAGKAREDLATAVAVTAAATGGYDSYTWTLLDSPPNDAMTAPSAASLSAPTSQATDVTPDNAGTYLLRVAASLAGVISTAEITFYAGATLASDPAACPRRMPSYLEDTQHSVPDAIDVSGNTVGWARELRRWLKVVTGLWNWMNSLLSPTPALESGADPTVVITRFELPPRCIHTASAGYLGYIFDLGAANLPAGCAASVLVDFTAQAVINSTTRFGGGAWKRSCSFSKDSVSGYLTLVGESSLIEIDAGAHTYEPATFEGAAGGTRTHTVVLNLGATTADATDWTVFANATIVCYPV
jgi:hypothetical protein